MKLHIEHLADGIRKGSDHCPAAAEPEVRQCTVGIAETVEIHGPHELYRDVFVCIQTFFPLETVLIVVHQVSMGKVHIHAESVRDHFIQRRKPDLQHTRRDMSVAPEHVQADRFVTEIQDPEFIGRLIQSVLSCPDQGDVGTKRRGCDFHPQACLPQDRLRILQH